MKRKTKPPIDDTPTPWEKRPVSRERWQKHRAWLMDGCVGSRPQEWWLYEQGREPPENETQVLYSMGELRGEELAKCMKWWRRRLRGGERSPRRWRQLRHDQKNASTAAGVSRPLRCAA